ncbi:MAG: MFS transporter [Puniceicoccales bacterium]|jgi:POT family proton-dependent oligopeptide transporter|nr:MFS transporter [Puniceicoccales bacterium]
MTSAVNTAPNSDGKPAANHFPPQTKFILGNEACERFSFYGMKSILALYALGVLGMSEDESTEIVHLFGAFVYLTPLLGAYLSDQIWGRYKTILWVSLLYCVGHATLAFSDFSPDLDFKKGCLFAGLAFIALGAGGIKPCVSAFMGDQFKTGQDAALARAYAAFYWCINLGSLGSFLIIPWLKDSYGYGWAFGVPGIFMAIATFVFWLGTPRYTHVPPARADTSRSGFFKIFFYALTGAGRVKGEPFWAAARRRFPAGEVADVIGALRVLWVFLLIPPFFGLFDQTSSTWIFQGKKMTPLLIGTYEFGAEQMQSANPAFVMLLIPLLTLAVYPFLGKWVSPLRRMGLGMFIAALSFVLVGWLQTRLEAGETLSLLWQLLPYLVLTVSEILVSTTGLEFAYTQAPKSMKSIITSLWLLTMFVGNLLVVAITRIGGSDGGASGAEGAASAASSERFFLYAGLMAATAVLFAVATCFYKYRREDVANAG